MAEEAATETPATEGLEEEDAEEEEDLDQLKEEIARMEAEAERLDKETAELKKEKPAAAASAATANKPKSDATSIYVGQVDYSTTPEELLKHFSGCGTVERVTIVCDKYSGRPKGACKCCFLCLLSTGYYL